MFVFFLFLIEITKDANHDGISNYYENSTAEKRNEFQRALHVCTHTVEE